MHRPEDTPLPEPPYFTVDTVLFSGHFPYFDRGNEAVEVRGKAHTSEERYRIEKGAEQAIRPIPTLAGQRTSIHLKPYVLVPDIRFTVGLYSYPKHYADQDPAVG